MTRTACTRYELRFPCQTCKCLTIPVTAQPATHAVQIDRHAHVRADVPCPVCGQHDQLINSWVSARARHHAVSLQRYLQHGYAVHESAALREPSDDELPWQSEAPTARAADCDVPCVYGDWRDRMRLVALEPRC